MKAPGANKLTGAVSYTPDRRSLWTCNGQSVALMPDTVTVRARMSALYGSTSFAVRPVAEVKAKSGSAGEVTFGEYVRRTTCDAANSFGFADLPDGPFFIVARATRVKPAPAAGDEGVVILQRILLAGGREARVKVPAFGG